MKLSDHDWRQIDDERINNLPESAVRNLSMTLLADLKEARERLNQNAKNSSVPPSSAAPWDKASKNGDDTDDTQENDEESITDSEHLEKTLSADSLFFNKLFWVSSQTLESFGAQTFDAADR